MTPPTKFVIHLATLSIKYVRPNKRLLSHFMTSRISFWCTRKRNGLTIVSPKMSCHDIRNEFRSCLRSKCSPIDLDSKHIRHVNQPQSRKKRYNHFLPSNQFRFTVSLPLRLFINYDGFSKMRHCCNHGVLASVFREMSSAKDKWEWGATFYSSKDEPPLTEAYVECARTNLRTLFRTLFWTSGFLWVAQSTVSEN